MVNMEKEFISTQIIKTEKLKNLGDNKTAKIQIIIKEYYHDFHVGQQHLTCFLCGLLTADQLR